MFLFRIARVAIGQADARVLIAPLTCSLFDAQRAKPFSFGLLVFFFVTHCHVLPSSRFVKKIPEHKRLVTALGALRHVALCVHQKYATTTRARNRPAPHYFFNRFFSSSCFFVLFHAVSLS
jgi:hypothetical protein